MKVVAVIDNEDALFKILKHLGLLGAEESRAPPATGPPAASPPPSQATPTLGESLTLPGLLDSIPRVLFADTPAWDAHDPPGPDHASQPDTAPGDLDDRDGGPEPDSEDIA